MKQMGFVARGANEQVFEQVIEYFHERFQENIQLDSLNLKDIKFDPQKGLESVADLRRMDISLRELSENFHIPKEIIVLERTLLLLMGLCTELDPTLNPMTVIRPYVERFVLGDEGDWSQLLVETSKDLVMSVTALPAEIAQVHARRPRRRAPAQVQEPRDLDAADLPARPSGDLRRDRHLRRGARDRVRGSRRDRSRDVGLVDRAARRACSWCGAGGRRGICCGSAKEFGEARARRASERRFGEARAGGRVNQCRTSAISAMIATTIAMPPTTSAITLTQSVGERAEHLIGALAVDDRAIRRAAIAIREHPRRQRDAIGGLALEQARRR